jgi:hypothetical protein
VRAQGAHEVQLAAAAAGLLVAFFLVFELMDHQKFLIPLANIM